MKTAFWKNINEEKLLYPFLIFFLCVIFFWKIFVYPDQLLFGKDTIGVYSHYKYLASETFKTTGELPFWDPYTFSGTPFLGNGQEALYYPINLLFYQYSSDLAFGPLFLIHFIIAGLGFFFLMRHWDIPPFCSFIGSLTFIFSLKFVSGIYAGHLPPFIPAAWAPWAFLFLDCAIRRNRFGYAFATGIVLSLAYLGGHIHVLFYLFFLLFLFFLFKVFLLIERSKDQKWMRSLTLFFTVFLIFSGLSAIQIFPFLENGQYLTRSEGVDLQGPGQNHLREKDLVRMFFPKLFGFPDEVKNRGVTNHLLETQMYVGILPIIFSLAAIIWFRKKPLILFWGMVSVFILLFSLGKNFYLYPIFHHYIPGFGLFRTPPRMMWFFSFSMAILTAFGAQALLGPSDRSKKFTLFLFFSIAVIVFISVLTALNFFPGGKKYILYVSLLILLTGMAVLIHLKKNHLGWTLKIFIISVLLFDLWSIGTPFVKTINREITFQKTISVSFLEKYNNDFRVLDRANDVRQTIAARSRVQSLSGYSSSILKHYSEFYGMIWDIPHLTPDINGMPTFPLEMIKNKHLLDLLNTRFIVNPSPVHHPDLELVFRGKYQKVPSGYSPNIFIYHNKGALPRAFVVRNAEVVTDQTAVFRKLRNLNPKERVLLEENIYPLNHPGEFQEAKINTYSPNQLNLEVNLQNPGFLVLSEIWHPGWRAYDQGKEIRIFKANYALRAVFLEEGLHDIKWVYDPIGYKIGKWITLLTVLGLAAYGGFFLKNKFKSNIKSAREAESRTEENQFSN